LIGRDSDANGIKLPGAKIVKEFNLIERNLCYQPGIATSAILMDFVREVKEDFRYL
jgi:hypothetical protein